jgi:hypothetical protein
VLGVAGPVGEVGVLWGEAAEPLLPPPLPQQESHSAMLNSARVEEKQFLSGPQQICFHMKQTVEIA